MHVSERNFRVYSWYQVMKNILVDMSATIIHHGHIRLLKEASKHGRVIVGLTSDEEILEHKGYTPELSFEERCEILEAIHYVDDVVKTPWMIDNEILEKHNIDFLIHGSDNSNIVDEKKLVMVDRTAGVSSSEIRERALQSILMKKNRKLMLTPGPASILYENIIDINPVFGRGDNEFNNIYKKVHDWVLEMSGQDNLIISQGSSTFSLDLAARSFIRGNVLIIDTGVYSDRFEQFLDSSCNVTHVSYNNINDIEGNFDWIMSVYTETSTAFLVDINEIKTLSNKLSSKLFIDATASIGLEDHHDLADVIAFSSCKGLFGLTGGSFMAYKNNLEIYQTDSFYFNLENQKNKMTTGPYHAICSIYGLIDIHPKLVQRVKNSKDYISTKYQECIRSSNQPLLATYLDAQISAKNENVVLYQPRINLAGSIICHLGEIHHDRIKIDEYINVTY